MTSAHQRSRMRDKARRGSSCATQLYQTSHLRSDEPAVHTRSGTTIAALRPRDAALPHIPIMDWFLSTSLTGSIKIARAFSLFIDESVLVFQTKRLTKVERGSTNRVLLSRFTLQEKGDSVQSEPPTDVSGRRWIRWILLLIVTVIGFAAVLVPALLIQPLKLQTPERLNTSYS